MSEQRGPTIDFSFESKYDAGYVVPWSIIRHITEDAARLPLSVYGGARYVHKPLTLRQRLRWHVREVRERIGFAIAGYTPSENDW